MLRAAGARHGFAVEAMDSVLIDGERASSSLVREALAAGQMERAARVLGRPYTIDGRVVHGDKIGRQLGFATANIRIKHDNPPLLGVFAVEVTIAQGLAHGDKTLRGVANLGFRPSANALQRALLEVHLLDFHGDLYGAHLNVRFVHKIRSEMKFPSFDALKAQISRDVGEARSYFHREGAKGQR